MSVEFSITSEDQTVASYQIELINPNGIVTDLGTFDKATFLSLPQGRYTFSLSTMLSPGTYCVRITTRSICGYYKVDRFYFTIVLLTST